MIWHFPRHGWLPHRTAQAAAQRSAAAAARPESRPRSMSTRVASCHYCHAGVRRAGAQDPRGHMRSAAVLFCHAVLLSSVAIVAQAQGAGKHRSKTNYRCFDGTLTSDIATSGSRQTDKAIATEVTTVATDPDPALQGKTTYQISVVLGPRSLSIYSIFGDSQPMVFPPAWQYEAPFVRRSTYATPLDVCAC
jgi:hypothetical protein